MFGTIATLDYEYCALVLGIRTASVLKVGGITAGTLRGKPKNRLVILYLRPLVSGDDIHFKAGMAFAIFERYTRR